MGRQLLTIAAVALVWQATALGQANETGSAYGAQAGDWEVTLGGGGTNDRDFDAGAFSLNGSIGYFLTDAWSVALRQDFAFADSGSDSSWSGSSRVALDYHFDLERFQPFVGGNLGLLYGEDVEETGAAGLEAGLKYYVKTDTFLYGRAEYQWLFESAEDADDTFDDGRFVYSVGIGFNF